MVTLQDISIQLMKPAKDLADWKFPLSQILEEYYALLEEPCNINFGEAALVLQNSVNVYVRRIESLLSETEVLKQMFSGYEERESKKNCGKERKSIKKICNDFDSFEVVDLEEEIGKNIEKKNQCQIQKKIKLLSHRFTQLQNNVTQLYIPMQVYDIHGEVMGRKYDFRCNQSVNVSGMLVDELTPDDFACILGTRVQNGRNPSLASSEPKTPGTRTSGYHSSTSLYKSVTPVNEEFEEECNSFQQMESIPTTNNIERDNTLDEESSSFSDFNASNDIGIGQSIASEDQSKVEYGDKHVKNNDSSDENTKNVSKVGERISINENVISKAEDNNQEINSCKENSIAANENLENTEKLSSAPKKRNQAAKISIRMADDINKGEWKPMSLTRGVKNVLSCDFSPQRLPTYLSTSKTKFESRKRKLTSKTHDECLTRFVLHETDSCKKERNTRSKPKFQRLRKQQLENFMKSFDECFNGAEVKNDDFHYEAVTGTARDLLGFRVSQKSDNFDSDNIQEHESRSSSPMSPEGFDQESSGSATLDMVKTSRLQNDLSYSLLDYRTLIEDKMKEIFEECNVTTELGHTVAKWHASLESKLSQAELRPAFRIHDYASCIIGTLEASDQCKVHFDKVVHGKPTYEVARYFLASLQLANTYNVEIKTENGENSIEIVLLDRRRD